METPRPARFGLLFPEDVARIWTEEARAEEARKFVKALKAAAADTLEWFPDVTRRTPRSDVDKAVIDLQQQIQRLIDTTVTVEMTERQVGAAIDGFHSQMEALRDRFTHLNGRNPLVKIARSQLGGLSDLIQRFREREPRTVPVTTVYSYVTKSRPTKPGMKPDKYAQKPVPEARARRGAKQPAWEADQEQELRIWWRGRPGRGVGGGRPRKNEPAPKQ